LATRPDVVVVGAGIVGAAVFHRLVIAGLNVTCIDRAGPGQGVTAAGMGHVAVMDDSDAQMALCVHSQARWREVEAHMGAAAETMNGGVTWLAEDDEEMAVCRTKQEYYAKWGLPSDVLDAQALLQLEPHVSPHLVGGFHLPSDHVVYQPRCAMWLVRDAVKEGGVFERRIVQDLSTIDAGVIVLCTGSSLAFLPSWLVIRPRKGHLMITPKGMPLCRSQLIELGYLKSAHGHADASVAFNLQPRPHGQNLLGSSREFGVTDPASSPRMLRWMIERAVRYVPALADAPILRSWTGFRPATDDHLPVIGPDPNDARILYAVGHEGLGITTCFATADLIAAQILGETPPIDPAPYLPDRMVNPHAA
jgi:glycine/D-amino acid oxidase-like deaminating enzyme